MFLLSNKKGSSESVNVIKNNRCYIKKCIIPTNWELPPKSVKKLIKRKRSPKNYKIGRNIKIIMLHYSSSSNILNQRKTVTVKHRTMFWIVRQFYQSHCANIIWNNCSLLRCASIRMHWEENEWHTVLVCTDRYLIRPTSVYGELKLLSTV